MAIYNDFVAGCESGATLMVEIAKRNHVSEEDDERLKNLGGSR